MLRFFISTGLILVCSNLFGQQIRVGLEGSPGISYYFASKNIPGVKSEPKFNYAVGGKAIIQLKDSVLFLETGFQYQQRGFKQIEAPLKTENLDIRINKSYYAIPLLVRLEFSNWFVALGPTFENYLKTKYNDVKSGTQRVIEFPPYGKFHWDKMGLEFNAGYSFNFLKRFTFNPHVNYNMGGYYRFKNFKQTGFDYNIEAGFTLLYGFNWKEPPIEQPKF